MADVIFHIASNRNITFDYKDESGYSEEEWADFTEAEKQEALMGYLAQNVEVWSDPE